METVEAVMKMAKESSEINRKGNAMLLLSAFPKDLWTFSIVIPVHPSFYPQYQRSIVTFRFQE